MEKVKGSVTERMRKANAESSDPSDSMGVWPLSYNETDPLFKIAQRQHDLDCVMHDAGVSDVTLTEGNSNFCKNLYFAANANSTVSSFVKATALCAIASSLTWIFW